MVTATTRSAAAYEFGREYFAMSHFVVQELSQFGRDVRTSPSTSKQLRAVNVDGTMLTRMVDLHYAVPRRFISSQSRDNFHSALSKPSNKAVVKTWEFLSELRQNSRSRSRCARRPRRS